LYPLLWLPYSFFNFGCLIQLVCSKNSLKGTHQGTFSNLYYSLTSKFRDANFDMAENANEAGEAINRLKTLFLKGSNMGSLLLNPIEDALINLNAIS
jgi:hypothetical protein